jgi:hypothetical protein
MTLNSCTLSGNLALGGDGGGNAVGCIHNSTPTPPRNSHLTLIRCNFSANKAVGGDGGGEAIGCISNKTFDVSQAAVTVTDCTFSDNQAVGGPGGGCAVGCIFNSAVFESAWAPAIITGCTFSNNSAIAGSFGGEAVGCIYNCAGSALAQATVNDCTFLGNIASGGEDGVRATTCIYNTSAYDYAVAYITADGCNFSNNNAANDDIFSGGCLHNDAAYGYAKAYMTLTGCFVTDNLITINHGDYQRLIGFVYNEASFDHSEAYLKTISCTIANNKAAVNSDFANAAALYNYEGWYNGKTFFQVKNSIVAGNFCMGETVHCDDAYGIFDSNSSYNFIGVDDGSSDLDTGIGTLFGTMESPLDPCFADPNNKDYHLKSQAGRWDPCSSTWVCDGLTSPCIDAGDPNSDWSKELWPHGKRINMGAYGNTPQAAMSLSDSGNIADLNTDGFVNFSDFALLARNWQIGQVLLAEDISRNGLVDTDDLMEFAEQWLWEE